MEEYKCERCSFLVTRLTNSNHQAFEHVTVYPTDMGLVPSGLYSFLNYQIVRVCLSTQMTELQPNRDTAFEHSLDIMCPIHKGKHMFMAEFTFYVLAWNSQRGSWLM